jgi:hypothetical protein
LRGLYSKDFIFYFYFKEEEKRMAEKTYLKEESKKREMENLAYLEVF